MTSTSLQTRQRMQIVDAIRGFALFGILLVHSTEHFELFIYPENPLPVLAWLDPIVKDVIFFIFAGKAYSIFSIMFGLSFFIQMRNQADKGQDFTGRFAWRLLLLFIIGYLFSLVYEGEVLTIFALLGLPLMIFYRLSNKALVTIAVIFSLQIPILVKLTLSFTQEGFVFQEDWSYWENVASTFSKGSFLEVVKFNSFSGHLSKWQYMTNSGRYLQMIGLFILGLLIGRSRFFERVSEFSSFISKVFLVSGVLFLILYLSKYYFTLFGFNEVQFNLLTKLTETYSNFCFTLFLMSGFIMIYQKYESALKSSLLVAFGKMSFSNYIIQGLISVPFYYGYGLAMYKYTGITLSVIIGLVTFILQLYFCKIWLRHYYYGPFEWLWRSLTFMEFKSNRKVKPEGELIAN